MTKAVLVALASVVIAAGPAFAHESRGHGGPRLRSSVPTRVFPHHRFSHGHNTRFGFGVAPPVIGYGYGITYGAPEYVPPPPTYYPPSYGYPSSYSPPVSYAPPPMQRVVEFASGRYVLEGDGITAPYRWVWIPNPPAEEPPAAPPAPASSPAPDASAPAPVRHLDYYRWTDADGVTHLTDSIDRVPEQYRAKARTRT